MQIHFYVWMSVARKKDVNASLQSIWVNTIDGHAVHCIQNKTVTFSVIGSPVTRRFAF